MDFLTGEAPYISEKDFAIVLYEGIRIELKNLLKKNVVYIKVVKERVSDLNILKELIDVEMDSEILDSLYEKYFD